MTAINGLVADLLAALPAPPTGCEPHTGISYGTKDRAVLHRMAIDHPGSDSRPGQWVAWWDYENGITVQVSFVGDAEETSA